MSPHRSLSYQSSRHPTTIQDIFLGLALKLHPAQTNNKTRDLEYTVVLHDGTGVVESETYHHDFDIASENEHEQGEEASRFAGKLLDVIRKVQTEKGYNVRFF
jgi:hypothetical protein